MLEVTEVPLVLYVASRLVEPVVVVGVYVTRQAWFDPLAYRVQVSVVELNVPEPVPVFAQVTVSPAVPPLTRALHVVGCPTTTVVGLQEIVIVGAAKALPAPDSSRITKRGAIERSAQRPFIGRATPTACSTPLQQSMLRARV